MKKDCEILNKTSSKDFHLKNDEQIFCSHDILKSISYFDIFSHPINKEEIQNLLKKKVDEETFLFVLNKLVESKQCFTTDGYYSIDKNVTLLVKQRKVKEIEAEKYFKKIPFYVGLIKSFPFVRGLAISGSLSKNVMYDDGDIDYFVITKSERLWICRTLLILFKKVFLLNSKKYFCVNYFVDENNLEIRDKNIFTAIELTYLMPIYNQSLIDKLKEVNSWKQSYLPHFKHPVKLKVQEGNGMFKRALEYLLNGSFGNKVDLFFMKITFKRWNKKFKHFDAQKFELTMRSNRGISKHHPQDFQNKVLKEYNNRLEKLGITV
ncbi:MAG: nucleotidyltransferase domain-containing protein [Vicingaceae bacterium]